MEKESKTPKSSDENNDKQNKNKLSVNSVINRLKDLYPVKNLEVDEDMEKAPISKPDFQKSEGQSSDHHTHQNKEKEKSSNMAHEEPELSFLDLQDHDVFQSLKTNKDKIKKILAVTCSILLIMVGIILISTSVTRVSDNVIFGERAMFAALLILIGFLILAGVFAGKLLQGTFIKKIQNELEITEGKTKKTEDDPTTPKDKGIKKKD